MTDEYVEKDKREAEATNYDAMMNLWFERWFTQELEKATKQDIGLNVDQNNAATVLLCMKAVIRTAFKTGWLKCEEFYS